VKSFIESGRISKVLSSTWAGQEGNGGPTTTEGVKYISDKEVGGILVTIHFRHAVDYVQFVSVMDLSIRMDCWKIGGGGLRLWNPKARW
jgi:hypothetical protein